MTKLDVLNLYLKERLKVAADEIFQVIKDTILEYQNEIALTKEENRDLKQRLADVGTISAGIQRGNKSKQLVHNGRLSLA